MWMLKDIPKCKEIVAFWRQKLSPSERPAHEPSLTPADIERRIWSMFENRERGSAQLPESGILDVSVDGMVERIATEFGWRPVDVYDVLDAHAMEITTDNPSFKDPVGILGYDRWWQAVMAVARKRLLRKDDG